LDFAFNTATSQQGSDNVCYEMITRELSVHAELSIKTNTIIPTQSINEIKEALNNKIYKATTIINKDITLPNTGSIGNSRVSADCCVHMRNNNISIGPSIKCTTQGCIIKEITANLHNPAHSN
jgi:hypothetical protein